MKKGKGLLTGLLLVLVMAAIITGSLVAGYKFITTINKDAKRRFEEVSKNIESASKEKLGISLDKHLGIDETKLLGYEEKEKRNYQGARIYECNSYIFNDRGDVLTDFFKEDSYGLPIRFDADRKYAVLQDRGDCYLIDSDLNYTRIARDCAYCGINFEGTYAFYTSSSGVCLYEIENKKEIQIDDSGFDACISPNGKMLCYIKYQSGGDTGIYVAGIDKEPEWIDMTDTGFFHPYAVSDDGKYAFYEANDTSIGTGLMCSNDGERYKLSKNYTRTILFDRNCQKVLFYYDKMIRYYDVFTNSVVDLSIDDDISELKSFGDYNYVLNDSYYSMILDASNFEENVIITGYKSVYCTRGVIPEAVLLANDYCNNFGLCKEGPGCVFIREDAIVKAVYSGGEALETTLYEDAEHIAYVSMNDDLSEGVMLIREKVEDEYVYNIYSLTEDGTKEFVAECGKDYIDSIRWDKFFKKCYYISDGNIYSLSIKTGETKLIASDCDSFDYVFSRDAVPGFKDNSGKLFYIINDEVYER
ncbi:MAG: hypothetical protein J6O03_06695 [Butyrivibrio sp.]|nr:hypothetical protein [Butyrivibrio sp.]